ncbi:MAG: hypothetical protein Q7R78_01350 [bacterium]|nr:hypothetical protein [bacterium]
MQTIRYKFLDIFQELIDGSLSPKSQIEINGVSFGPGVIFQKGVAFGGVDFHLYKYFDIATEKLSDGTLRIIGFYK